jgi:spermidine synthase
MDRRDFFTSLAGLLASSGLTACAAQPGDRPRESADANTNPRDDPGPALEQVLARASSDYNEVIVTQEGRLRRMYFEVADGRRLLQSTYDLDRPNSLDHEVFQTMVAGLLVTPTPARVCMIGVGGAQLSNFLFARLPGIEIDAVDICPAVVKLAREYFGVPDDPRYRLHVGDGRVFIEQAPARSYDLLIVDAYRGHSVPRHLRTREFFSACADKLTATGALVANMHRRTPRYPIDRATIASVFEHSYRFSSPDDVQTTIVASKLDVALGPDQLLANARAVQPRVDFDLLGLARRCTTAPDWGDAQPLVDDFDHAQLDAVAEQSNRSCTPTCAGDE